MDHIFTKAVISALALMVARFVPIDNAWVINQHVSWYHTHSPSYRLTPVLGTYMYSGMSKNV